MEKNFDYQVVDKTNEGADIQLMDWISGADYTEGQVIPRQSNVVKGDRHHEKWSASVSPFGKFILCETKNT